MNKFVCVALLAFVAVAAAGPISSEMDGESQGILNPTDSEETAGLEGNKKMFTDYCIAQRDYIYKDVKDNTNGAAAKMYAFVFSSAEAVGQEAIDASKLAVNRLGNQIAHPDSEIQAAAGEVESIIAEGQQKIQQEQVQPKTLVQAFLTTVQATKKVVSDRVSAGLDSVTSLVGIRQAISLLEGTCNKVAEYEATLHANFLAARKEIAAVDGSLADAKFENIGCLTIKRIIYADSICKFAKAIQAPTTRMVQARKN